MNPVLLNALGATLIRKGDIRAAEAYFQKALQANREFTAA